MNTQKRPEILDADEPYWSSVLKSPFCTRDELWPRIKSLNTSSKFEFSRVVLPRNKCLFDLRDPCACTKQVWGQEKLPSLCDPTHTHESRSHTVQSGDQNRCRIIQSGGDTCRRQWGKRGQRITAKKSTQHHWNVRYFSFICFKLNYNKRSVFKNEYVWLY